MSNNELMRCQYSILFQSISFIAVNHVKGLKKARQVDLIQGIIWFVLNELNLDGFMDLNSSSSTFWYSGWIWKHIWAIKSKPHLETILKPESVSNTWITRILMWSLRSVSIIVTGLGLMVVSEFCMVYVWEKPEKMIWVLIVCDLSNSDQWEFQLGFGGTLSEESCLCLVDKLLLWDFCLPL